MLEVWLKNNTIRCYCDRIGVLNMASVCFTVAIMITTYDNICLSQVWVGQMRMAYCVSM